METTIPALPSISADETLDFYQTLGFEFTYIQRKPYVYLAARRDGINIHFYGLKGLDPKDAHSTCLVMVPDPAPYHAEFAQALKTKLGKVPTVGIPRITRFREGQSRFTVVDPSGNSVIYIRHDEPNVEYQDSDSDLTGLPRAFATAVMFRDFRNDDKGAAQILDVALARYPDADPAGRARALAARIELAVAMEDAARAQTALAEFQQIALSAADRARLQNELPSAEELAQQVKQLRDELGR